MCGYTGSVHLCTCLSLSLGVAGFGGSLVIGKKNALENGHVRVFECVCRYLKSLVVEGIKNPSHNFPNPPPKKVHKGFLHVSHCCL